MIVKVVEDKQNGRKWEIIKHENKEGFTYPVYTVNYYEYYSACGWRIIANGANDKEYCDKQYITEEFGEVA